MDKIVYFSISDYAFETVFGLWLGIMSLCLIIGKVDDIIDKLDLSGIVECKLVKWILSFFD